MAVRCGIQASKQEKGGANEGDSPLVQASAHRQGTPDVDPASPLTSQGWRKTHPGLVHDAANLHVFSPAPAMALGSATGGARGALERKDGAADFEGAVA